MISGSDIADYGLLLDPSLVKDRSVQWISGPDPLGEGSYPGVEADERSYAL